MYTKEKILDSIKYVVDNSNYVSIKEDNIGNATNLLANSKKKTWLNNDFLDNENLTNEEKIKYLILCESLNFCFWGTTPKWQILYNDEYFSGSYALFFAIAKAIKNGENLLDNDYLANMTLEKLDQIFKGTTSIPLLKERLNIIKQLAQEFKNIDDLTKTINAKSDIELFNVILSYFSNFQDISIYKGKEIYFFKRAILLVEDLITNIDYLKKQIKNNDNMQACADYKIPQVLRCLGILEYNEELSKLIDEQKEIPNDSEMEIEIRAKKKELF